MVDIDSIGEEFVKYKKQIFGCVIFGVFMITYSVFLGSGKTYVSTARSFLETNSEFKKEVGEIRTIAHCIDMDQEEGIYSKSYFDVKAYRKNIRVWVEMEKDSINDEWKVLSYGIDTN